MATILTDVTERKKLEARLRQAAKMEAIGTLASGVAHEINNPINIIMNYAGLILRQEVTRDDVETFAREIVNESERIATIVRNLLAFARQEQEMPSPATISGIVESALSLMKKVLDNDQITIRVDVPEDLPQIQCRRQQIEQVLVNLLTNARHALNERFPRYSEEKILEITASVFERDGRQWIRTGIEDRGPGISAEVIDRIFDPFFTTKPGGSGTGLGLSVSHGIVDDHSGRLTVRSQVGQYTRFIVELPVYDPESDWPRFEQRPYLGGPSLF
jgi:signal transduction histidine kinase